jgi:hypothetical protein
MNHLYDFKSLKGAHKRVPTSNMIGVGVLIAFGFLRAMTFTPLAAESLRPNMATVNFGKVGCHLLTGLDCDFIGSMVHAKCFQAAFSMVDMIARQL